MLSSQIKYHFFNTDNRSAGTVSNPTFENLFLDTDDVYMSLIEFNIPKIGMMNANNSLVKYQENGIVSDANKIIAYGDYDITNLLKALENILDNMSLTLHGGNSAQAYKFICTIYNGSNYGTLVNTVSYNSGIVSISTIKYQDGTNILDLALVSLNNIVITITLTDKLAKMLGYTNSTIKLTYLPSLFTALGTNNYNLNYFAIMKIRCSNIISKNDEPGNKASSTDLLEIVDLSQYGYQTVAFQKNESFLTNMHRIGNNNTNKMTFSFVDQDDQLVEFFGIGVRLNIASFNVKFNS